MINISIFFMSPLGRQSVHWQEFMSESVERVAVLDTDHIEPCLASKL